MSGALRVGLSAVFRGPSQKNSKSLMCIVQDLAGPSLIWAFFGFHITPEHPRACLFSKTSKSGT